jgi:hypothetical protein
MERRNLLRAVGGLAGVPGAVGATGPLAGCLGRPAESRRTSGFRSRPRSPPRPAGPADADLPLPESAFVRAADRDAVPATVEPAFAPDWSGVSVTVSNPGFGTYESTPRLGDHDFVVGIASGAGGVGGAGDARTVPRAYPLCVLT